MLTPDTAVPYYANLADTVDATAEFHRNFSNQRAAEILENRQELFEWIRKECETRITSWKALEKLRTDSCLFLMTAHQPNLFV